MDSVALAWICLAAPPAVDCHCFVLSEFEARGLCACLSIVLCWPQGFLFCLHFILCVGACESQTACEAQNSLWELLLSLELRWSRGSNSDSRLRAMCLPAGSNLGSCCFKVPYHRGVSRAFLPVFCFCILLIGTKPYLGKCFPSYWYFSHLRRALCLIVFEMMIS